MLSNALTTLRFAALSIYLYGDLAIYAVMVPKTIRKIVLGFFDATADEAVVYHSALAATLAITLPWVFFQFRKTTLLQLISICTRAFCFSSSTWRES
jgi:hypothetical protein